MKAIVCTKYGPPEVLQIHEVATPIPKDDQILVKIVATAVNSGDVRVRSLDVKGIMRVAMQVVVGITRPRKSILGTVYAGIVEEVGKNVTRFNVGDKVFGMTGFAFGTYAEFIAVGQNSNVLEMPVNASFEEAASIIFGGQTAIHFLEKAKIAERSHPCVLILGATGSVGSAAAQIAKHHHTHVTAVCSSEGHDLAALLGVDGIVHYDEEDITRRTEKYDIIFDAIGTYNARQFKALLNDNGVFVSVSAGYASENMHQLRLLKEMFEQGTLIATIDRTYKMDDIVEAHRYVDTGRKKGNVVVRIRP
ncbi:MAG: NAD(P)-dependent alcohol dehydrogenase [Bacteroidetes bacterium]|nr:NAD(P)-dependent alcohol dehydrogenase [Bacteroidota bacterium]